MKFVGFAILMKVMMSGEMWGFLLAGFCNGTYLCSKRINSRSNTSPLCIVGAAIATMTHNTDKRIKQNAGAGAGFVGGDQDGI